MLALPYELIETNAFSSYVMFTRFDPTSIPPGPSTNAPPWIVRPPRSRSTSLSAAVLVVEVVDDAPEVGLAAQLEDAVRPDQDAAVVSEFQTLFFVYWPSAQPSTQTTLPVSCSSVGQTLRSSGRPRSRAP